MTYIVRWNLDALQEVARVEREAVDPAAVRLATGWVEYTLRRIPYNVGESRGRNRREWYEDVLGVYYAIDDAAGTVDILAAGPARRH